VAHWIPALQPFLFENMFKRLKALGLPDLKVLAQAEESFNRYATVLDRHLSGRRYIVGDGLTLADIAVASYLMYGQQASVPLARYSDAARWFEKIAALPAWCKVQPDAMA
jgi:glutathione S-transferase